MPNQNQVLTELVTKTLHTSMNITNECCRLKLVTQLGARILLVVRMLYRGRKLISILNLVYYLPDIVFFLQ